MPPAQTDSVSMPLNPNESVARPSETAQNAAGHASPRREAASSESLLKRIMPKLIISMLLGGLFLFLAQRGGVPIIPSSDSFEHFRWELMIPYVVLLLSTHWFRASRWRFLIAPIQVVPYFEGILLNWIGFFAIFALPFRLGEMARPSLTKIRRGITLSTGLGTVAVERVIDGLVTSLCVVLGLSLPHLESEDPLVRSLPYYGTLAVTVFSAALFGLVLFLWQRSLALRLVDWTFGLLSERLAKSVAEKVDGVADGIRSIGNPTLAGGFLFETLVYWSLNALGMWVLALACGLPMSVAQGFSVMGVLAIGILLPAGPGMFGTFQLAIMVALKLFFPESMVAQQGALYIFLMYATQATMVCLTGIIPLYALNLSFADLLRAPSEGERASASALQVDEADATAAAE